MTRTDDQPTPNPVPQTSLKVAERALVSMLDQGWAPGSLDKISYEAGREGFGVLRALGDIRKALAEGN